jgi:hypothetical protein
MSASYHGEETALPAMGSIVPEGMDFGFRDAKDFITAENRATKVCTITEPQVATVRIKPKKQAPRPPLEAIGRELKTHSTWQLECRMPTTNKTQNNYPNS